jgi:hypothetical protein
MGSLLAKQFSPKDLQGLGLWLKTDAGVTTTPETFISQVVVSGAGTTTSNGTYTRTAGGFSQFTGPNGNIIFWDGEWIIYDDNEGTDTYRIDNFDFTGVWTDINASLPVPTSSTSTTPTGTLLVTAWADQSGNGKNATTENGGDDSPVFVSSAQNSKPAIQFNNSDLEGTSFMRIASPAFNLKNSTAFFVTKQSAQLSFARLFSFLSADGDDYATNDGMAVLYNATTDPRQFQIESNFGGAFENASNYEAFGVASYTITSDGLITPFFNSIAGTSHTNEDMAPTNGADALIAQGSQLLGASSFDGQIAEIVIYNREVTTPERQQVEAYLNQKYAIYSPIPNTKISIKKQNLGGGKLNAKRNPPAAPSGIPVATTTAIVLSGLTGPYYSELNGTYTKSGDPTNVYRGGVEGLATGAVYFNSDYTGGNRDGAAIYFGTHIYGDGEVGWWVSYYDDNVFFLGRVLSSDSTTVPINGYSNPYGYTGTITLTAAPAGISLTAPTIYVSGLSFQNQGSFYNGHVYNPYTLQSPGFWVDAYNYNGYVQYTTQWELYAYADSGGESTAALVATNTASQTSLPTTGWTNTNRDLIVSGTVVISTTP